MGLRRLTALLIGTFLTAAACRARDDAPESGARHPGPGTGGTPPRSVSWFPGALPLLLLPSDANDRALVAFADSTVGEMKEGPMDSTATLIRLDGSRLSGRVTISRAGEGCTEGAIDPPPAGGWGAGFIGAVPVSLPADSLAGLSRADSTSLTRTAFRLASAVPNGDGGRFAGLAFTLVDLWRVRLPGGAFVLVASVRRQLNQEDSPLQERTFIVAEADSGSAEDYSLVHSDRSSGLEETVESRELLAAFAFPTLPVAMVVGRDFGDQRGYTILERSGPRRWTVRWSSRRFSC
jgi:hypothetical protein